MATSSASHVPNPLARAGIISRLLFLWPEGIMKKKGSVGEGELYDLLEDDSTKKLHGALSAAWQAEVCKHPASPSLGRAFFSSFFWAYCIHWPSLYVKQALVIAQTQFLGLLLSTLNSADDSDNGRSAYLYGLGLVLCAFVSAILHHVYYFEAWRAGMRWRAAATALVAEKALKLRLDSLSRISAGFVINLVAGDIERLQKYAQYIPYVLLAPIETAVCCWLLYREVGISFLGGLAVLLVMAVLMAFFSAMFGKLRHQTAVITDERVRVTGQVVSGIRTVKIAGWEAPFAQRVSEIRKRESGKTAVTSWVRGVNEGLFVVASILIACATFLIFTVGLGNTLTAAKLWTTMSLFAVLQLEAGKFFPLALEARAEVAISMKRMQEFLVLEEMTGRAGAVGANASSAKTTSNGSSNGGVVIGNPLQQGSSASAACAEIDTGITVNGLTCTWGSSSGSPSATANTIGTAGTAAAATLSDVTFRADSGKLTMCVGPVSCGKSSFLQAIMGELPATAGTVTIGRTSSTTSSSPTIAYVSQTPWIMTATLRENITFGLPFDQARYDRVIDACCLKEDIAMLPQGDLTMQGEKGVSLSGGQRSRLALARACYLDADIYLIDDVLAAVDAKVGRRIFKKCIGAGYLAGKTRVLALHQLQYLRSADSIAVMSGGRIFTQGNFGDLSKALAAEKRNGHAAHHGGDSLGAALSDILLAAGDHHHHHHGAARRSRGSSAVSHDAARLSAAADAAEDEDEFEDLEAELAGEGLEEDDESGKGSSLRLQPVPVLAASDSTPSSSDTANPSVASPGSVSEAGTAGSVDAAVEPVKGAAAISPVSPPSAAKPAAVQAAPGGAAPSGDGGLIQAEKISTGTVSFDTYRRYFVASGGCLHFFYLMLLMFGGAALFLYSSVWISVWANTDPVTQAQALYPRTFGILCAVSLVVSIWRASAFFLACVAASRQLHDISFTHVLKAPLGFYDANPSGRILNRLSKDVGILDDLLPATLFDFLSALATVLAIVVLIVVVNPYVLISLPFLLVALYFIQAYYILSSRQIKRIEGVTRSPIFSLLNESLNGLPVIRAFKMQPILFERMLHAIDGNSKAYFVFLGISRWLGVRLDALCVALYAVTTFACIALRSSISASMIGLVLSQTATLVSGLQWTIRQWIETQNQFTSVERVLEYCSLETEALDVSTTDLSGTATASAVRQGPAETSIVLSGTNGVPPGWPLKGEVTINDLWLCYRPELPPVLKGLTAKIPAGSKVGAVGRTGAGKSSLLGTLLRLVEPERHPLRADLVSRIDCKGPSSGIKNPAGASGICIDGIDIASVPLTQLRRAMSVIPQSPTLYSGTVRFNCDPFNQFSDEEIITALKRSQLWDKHLLPHGGLSYQVKEDGSNLSVGARQLLCLARAVLRQSRILLLDEASANVDEDTDNAIQTTLKTAFEGCTVIVVAHRLNTVASSDLILTLADGRAAELEHPHVLLNVKKSGHFYDLAIELGEEGFAAVSQEARKAWEAKHGPSLAAVSDAGSH